MTPESAPDADAMAAIMPEYGTNSGHGHAWSRPDGVRARCGGPAMCSLCAADSAKAERTRLAAWNHRTDPLHAQALAAGYASVADWVAVMVGEIARLRDFADSVVSEWDEYCESWDVVEDDTYDCDLGRMAERARFVLGERQP